MRGCARLSRTCFRLRLVNAVWCISNATCFHAIPRRERSDVQVELVGIWEQPTKQEALIHLAADHQPSTLSAIQKRSAVWLRMKSTC